MDPVTGMMIASGIMSLFSGGSSILGGISGGKAAKKAAKADAAAELRLTQAKLEDLKAEEQVMRGSTIAGAAGSGVKVDKGSPLEVLA